MVADGAVSEVWNGPVLTPHVIAFVHLHAQSTSEAAAALADVHKDLSSHVKTSWIAQKP